MCAGKDLEESSVAMLQGSPTLRRAAAVDAEFAFRVLKETMRGYAIATWGTWWEDESRREMIEQMDAGKTQVIELHGMPVGIQLIDRLETHIQLVQLYILKEYQRQGLGTRLLNALLTEATQSKLPVRLQVLAVNPATALYERLGFVVVEATPERYFMEWSPPSRGAENRAATR